MKRLQCTTTIVLLKKIFLSILQAVCMLLLQHSMHKLRNFRCALTLFFVVVHSLRIYKAICVFAICALIK